MGGKFRPGEAQTREEVIPNCLPAQVVLRLLTRGGGPDLGFAPAAVNRVDRVLSALVSVLGAEAAVLKRETTELRNALLCISPVSLAEQKNFSLSDAAKLLMRVPPLRQFAPEPNQLPLAPKAPVAFVINQPQPLLVPPPVVQPSMPMPFGSNADASEIPKKRGRGRPPLRPKTEQQQFRTFTATSASAPIPDITT